MSSTHAAAPVRVGLVQLRTPATPREAVEHIVPLVHRAAAQGAQLVLTPEASNAMQRDRDRLQPTLTALDEDPVVRTLSEVAVERGVEILVGSALVRDGERFANRAALIGRDGAIRTTYDKIHMFDVDLPGGESARESHAYAPGERAVVIDSAAGRLGLTICYDLRFAALFRSLAQAGAQLIAVPAAFTRTTGEAHWEVLLRARAIETGAWVLAPAQGGRHADGRGTWGRSMVVSPWGEVTARLDHDDPGVLMADLDLAAVAAARGAIPALTHDRAFALA